MQACAGGVALTHQHRLAGFRVRSYQVVGALFGHTMRPIGLVAAGISLLLGVDHLQPDDLVTRGGHGDQQCPGTRGITHTHPDDLLAFQIGAAALFRHAFEQARRAIGSPASGIGGNLSGTALGVFLTSTHHVALLLTHAPGFYFDLVAVARAPITEAAENQNFVFLGAVLMDHVPAVFLLALVLCSLAAGELAESQRLRRLKAVVSELTENVIEHNEYLLFHSVVGRLHSVCNW